MQVIPVIDVKNGVVVHAKQGMREAYSPIVSSLCKSHDIFDVVNVFWTAFHSRIIYIADIDAITQKQNNAALLLEVLQVFPDITFWIDGGFPLPDMQLTQRANFVPVLGSESFHDGNLAEINGFSSSFILSLDFFESGEMGAKSLFSTSQLWPEFVIVMNLSKVGSNLGPDLEKLSTYQTRYPQHKFIAAGGIRGKEDLKTLAKIGINYALVATALHNGKIRLREIENL